MHGFGRNGSIKRFSEMDKISFKSVCGEAVRVDGEAGNNWKANIHDIFANLH